MACNFLLLLLTKNKTKLTDSFNLIRIKRKKLDKRIKVRGPAVSILAESLFKANKKWTETNSLARNHRSMDKCRNTKEG